jgi:hypothetical protein
VVTVQDPREGVAVYMQVLPSKCLPFPSHIMFTRSLCFPFTLTSSVTVRRPVGSSLDSGMTKDENNKVKISKIYIFVCKQFVVKYH